MECVEPAVVCVAASRPRALGDAEFWCSGGSHCAELFRGECPWEGASEGIEEGQDDC